MPFNARSIDMHKETMRLPVWTLEVDHMVIDVDNRWVIKLPKKTWKINENMQSDMQTKVSRDSRNS